MQHWSKTFEYLRKRNIDEMGKKSPLDYSYFPTRESQFWLHLQHNTGIHSRQHDAHSILWTRAEQKSVLGTAQRSILRSQFDGLRRRPDCDLAFLCPRKKSAGSPGTHQGLYLTVSSWLQQSTWTDPIAHKIPASLAGWWTCKCNSMLGEHLSECCVTLNWNPVWHVRNASLLNTLHSKIRENCHPR